MRPLVAVCAAIACLVAAPSALAAPQAKTETASSGAVAATLTYTMASEWEASDVRVSITRDGAAAAVARDGLVAAGCRMCRGAIPVGGFQESGAQSLTLADLTGDGDPEVIVDVYTGGAHCCSISAIYGWDAATSSYRRVIRFWGDPSYSLEAIGGGPAPVLVTNDYRFAYAFCAYACSAMPVQVFRYEPFRLVDVTTQFPQQLRTQVRDLRATIRRLSRRGGERFAIRGMLPALCADLYRLDRGDACRRALNQALRRGWLRSRGELDFGPSGRAYVSRVLRFLDRTGYR